LRLLHALEQPTIWLSVERSVSSGRATRDYVIYDDAGALLLTAQTWPWRRDIVVQTATEPEQQFLLLRRRLSFQLTGRVDVYDEARGRLGTVSRSGRYRDSRGRVTGRFRDARSFGHRSREAVLVGVLDALLGGDGTTADTGGPGGYVWLVGSEVMGTLARARLPSTVDDAAGASPSAPTIAGRLAAFGERLRAFVRARPQGWKLERRVPRSPGDPRLILAAALFAIELSHW
jgi:hypothetical protein